MKNKVLQLKTKNKIYKKDMAISNMGILFPIILVLSIMFIFDAYVAGETKIFPFWVPLAAFLMSVIEMFDFVYVIKFLKSLRENNNHYFFNNKKI